VTRPTFSERIFENLSSPADAAFSRIKRENDALANDAPINFFGFRAVKAVALSLLKIFFEMVLTA
jgi:hypothetical protein